MARPKKIVETPTETTPTKEEGLVMYKKPGKNLSIKLVTPLGRFSWPSIAKPNDTGEYANNKYQVELLIPKTTWKELGAGLRTATLTVAQDYWGKDKIKSLADIPARPFRDGDELAASNEKKAYYAGNIVIKPKSTNKPRVVGPRKQDLTPEEVAAIKGGDFGRLVVSVYPYAQKGGGIALGLECVQFSHAGEPFGNAGGSAASLGLLDELEVELADLDSEEEAEEPADDILV